MTHPATKHLKEIRNERFFRVFDDWLELMIAAHTKDEEGYMKTMRRYGPRASMLVHIHEMNGPEGIAEFANQYGHLLAECERILNDELLGRKIQDHPADHFTNALGTIMQAMREDNAKGNLRDHLGEIYETEAQSNKEMGQFFTPMELCKLMAEMTITGDVPKDATVCDPACGSGRNLMAAIPRLGFQATYYATDLDRTCAKMTAMNLLWRNVNSFVVWGDTLRLQARGGWYTRHTLAGGEIGVLDQERAQAILESSVRAMAEHPQQVLATPEKKAEIQQMAEEIKIRENKRGQFEIEL